MKPSMDSSVKVSLGWSAYITYLLKLERVTRLTQVAVHNILRTIAPLRMTVVSFYQYSPDFVGHCLLT